MRNTLCFSFCCISEAGPLSDADTTEATKGLGHSYPTLLEDFEISYIRTDIGDLPLHCPSQRLNTGPIIPYESYGMNDSVDSSENAEMEDEESDAESEGGQLRVTIKLASTSRLGDSKGSTRGKSIVTEDLDLVGDKDSDKKWHFDGKAYSISVDGRERFYCQLCEDDSTTHFCFKRREMERHLRRMNHLPPELFCKEAKAACPCSRNRAFTRIDGRKRHIKISIEHARQEALSTKDYAELERLDKLFSVLEATRGR